MNHKVVVRNKEDNTHKVFSTCPGTIHRVQQVLASINSENFEITL